MTFAGKFLAIEWHYRLTTTPATCQAEEHAFQYPRGSMVPCIYTNLTKPQELES